MNEIYTDSRVYKGNILYRGRIGNKRIQEKIKYEPYLFVDSQTNTEYKTIYEKPVKRINFNSISEARSFVREHENIHGFNIYGLTNYEYLFIYDKFPGKLSFVRENLSIGSIDIECQAKNGFPDPKIADQMVTMITLTKGKKAYMFGLKPYYPKDESVTYILCDDEKDLLSKFIMVWQKLDFDIVTGWNVEKFDFPYLINRIIRVFDEDKAKQLSPWNIIESKLIPTKWGSEEQSFDIYGITVLDYMDLYKKFSYKNQESFKLDHIAFVELEENKLDYSEYGSLDRLYELNPDLYADYNLHDARLVDKLETKLGFINIVLNMAYKMKCNYIDTFRTVKPWDICIHAYLMDKGYVIPHKTSSFSNRDLVGGFVKEVNGGVYDWVASFDLKSSYPHQAITYNISPETFVEKKTETIDYSSQDIPIHIYEQYSEYAKSKNLSMAGNLAFFSKNKRGFIAQLMLDFFNERAEYQNKLSTLELKYNETKDSSLKNEMASLDAIQLAIKILINSLYGALSNQGSRWYSIDLAEAITSSGQLSVKWAIKETNDYLNKLTKIEKDRIVASDTDSLYVDLSEIAAKLNLTDKQKICDAIQKLCDVHLHKVIKDGFEKMAILMNSYDPQIKMARENIADRAIWTSTKHYVMNVLDCKGVRYDKPKLKMVGIEAIKSTIPMICKDELKKSIEIIMNNTNEDLLIHIDKFKEKFYNLPFTEVAFPRGVSDVTKYSDKTTIYKKGTPIHVRASLLYNKLIDDNNLEKTNLKIFDGNKIKFTYLTLPNPIRENVIASPDDLPDIFGLSQYIDYETQFEKSFLKPLDDLCVQIGWKTKRISTLEDFFA